MEHYYWNDWYAGWGWFLWFGIFLLMFSSIGNWGYTYKAHLKYGTENRKTALDILDERYAKSEIARDEYMRMKSEITDSKADYTKTRVIPRTAVPT